MCKIPCLDHDCFSKLHYLPDPQPDTNRPGHFLPFSKLKGQDTEEKYCPSLKSHGERQTSGAPPGMLVEQRLRSTVNRDECHKPWGIYAQRVSSVKEKKELEVLRRRYTTHAAYPSRPRAVHCLGQCLWQLTYVVTTMWSLHIMHALESNLMFAASVQHHKRRKISKYYSTTK